MTWSRNDCLDFDDTLGEEVALKTTTGLSSLGSSSASTAAQEDETNRLLLQAAIKRQQESMTSSPTLSIASAAARPTATASAPTTSQPTVGGVRIGGSVGGGGIMGSMTGVASTAARTVSAAQKAPAASPMPSGTISGMLGSVTAAAREAVARTVASEAAKGPGAPSGAVIPVTITHPGVLSAVAKAAPRLSHATEAAESERVRASVAQSAMPTSPALGMTAFAAEQLREVAREIAARKEAAANGLTEGRSLADEDSFRAEVLDWLRRIYNALEPGRAREKVYRMILQYR